MMGGQRAGTDDSQYAFFIVSDWLSTVPPSWFPPSPEATPRMVESECSVSWKVGIQDPGIIFLYTIFNEFLSIRIPDKNWKCVQRKFQIPDPDPVTPPQSQVLEILGNPPTGIHFFYLTFVGFPPTEWTGGRWELISTNVRKEMCWRIPDFFSFIFYLGFNFFLYWGLNPNKIKNEEIHHQHLVVTSRRPGFKFQETV